MGENETLEGFKRNMKAVAAGVANERISVVDELEKAQSWIRWVHASSVNCTHAHADYLRIYAAHDIARALLRRKYTDPAKELPEVNKFLRWVLEISAINCHKGLDTDRSIWLILDPEQSLWQVDRPAPYGEVLEAKEKQAATAAAAAADNAPGASLPPEPAAAPVLAPSDSDMSISDPAFAAALRADDVCDFCDATDRWVFARVVELSATDTELHLEDMTSNVREWISIEDHFFRVAPMGTRAGKEATGGAAAGSPTVPLLVTDPAELAWRTALGVGHMLDCQDGKSARWLQACVLDTRPPPAAPLATASAAVDGVAVVDGSAVAAAAALGDVRVTLLGCGIGKADEWLPRASTRLARLNYRSGGRRGTAEPVRHEVDAERDYHSVLPPCSTDPTRAAVVRLWSPSPLHKGLAFVETWNYFWLLEAGGLQHPTWSNVLQRAQAIAGKDRPAASFLWLAEMTACLGRAADVSTDAFVTALVVPWLAACDAYVRSMDEEAVRAVTKEATDALVLGVRRLASRVAAVGSKAGPAPAEALLASAQRAESLMLAVALRCCRSSQIMRRREGLKLLSDARALAFNASEYAGGVYVPREQRGRPWAPSVAEKDYLRLPTATWLTLPALARCVAEAGLLRDIFVSRHHRELVKMSADLLRLLAEARLLPDAAVDDLAHSLGGNPGADAGGGSSGDADATVAVICELQADLPAAAHERLLCHILAPSLAAAGLPLVNDAAMGGATGAGTSPSAAPAVAAGSAGGGSGAAAPVYSKLSVKLLSAIARSAPGQRIELSDGNIAEEDIDRRASAAVVRKAVAALFTLSLGLQPGISLLQASGGSVAASSGMSPVSPSLSVASSSVSSDVIEAASSALVSLLQHSDLNRLRLPYLQTCIALLRARTFGLRALALLRGIVDTFPTSRASAVEASQQNPRDLGLSGFTFDASALAGGVVKKKRAAATSASFVIRAALPTAIPVDAATAATLVADAVPLATAVYAAAEVDDGMTMSEVVGLLQSRHRLVEALLGYTAAFCDAARRQARGLGLPTWSDVQRERSLLRGDGADVDGTATGSAVASDDGDSEVDTAVIGLPQATSSQDAKEGDDRRLSAKAVALAMYDRSGPGIGDPRSFLSSLDNLDIHLLASPQRIVSVLSASTAAMDEGSGIPAVITAVCACVGCGAASGFGSHLPATTAVIADKAVFSTGIKTLFSGISHVVMISELLISAGQTVRLWHECVTRAISHTHRTLFLLWLAQGVINLSAAEGAVTGAGAAAAAAAANPDGICPTSFGLQLVSLRSLVFGPDVVSHLFHAYLNSPAFVGETDAGSLDNAGFTAWRCFFVYVNGRLGRLQHPGNSIERVGVAADTGAVTSALPTLPLYAGVATIDEAEGSSAASSAAGFQVHSLELVGLDSLWQVTLKSEDATVASAAVSLLTTLQQRVSSALLPKLGEFRRRYIERCMSFIMSASALLQSNSQPSASHDWPWSTGVVGGAQAGAITEAAPTLSRASSSSSATSSPARAPVLARAASSGYTASPLLRSGASEGAGTAAQLIERCVALLDSMLDEAEEEQATVAAELQECLAVAHTVTDQPGCALEASDGAATPAGSDVARASAVKAISSLGADDLLLKARETLLAASGHAHEASAFLSPFDTCGRGNSEDGDLITVRVNFNVKVYGAGSTATGRLDTTVSPVAQTAAPDEGKECDMASLSGITHSSLVDFVTAAPSATDSKVGGKSLDGKDEPEQKDQSEGGGVVDSDEEALAAVAAMEANEKTTREGVPAPRPPETDSATAVLVPQNSDKLAAVVASTTAAQSCEVKRSVRSDEVRLSIRRHEPLARLRATICTLLGVHHSALRIVIPTTSVYTSVDTNKPRELRGALLGHTLSEIGFHDSGLVTVFSRAPPDSASRSQSYSTPLRYTVATNAAGLSSQLQASLRRFHSLPASLIAGSAHHMNQLLSLVDTAHSGASSEVQHGPGRSSLPGATAARIWRLLCRLPTHTGYARSLRDSWRMSGGGGGRGEPLAADASVRDAWPEILPSASPSKLLYGLLATRRILSEADAASATSNASSDCFGSRRAAAVSLVLPKCRDRAYIERQASIAESDSMRELVRGWESPISAVVETGGAETGGAASTGSAILRAPVWSDRASAISTVSCAASFRLGAGFRHIVLLLKARLTPPASLALAAGTCSSLDLCISLMLLEGIVLPSLGPALGVSSAVLGNGSVAQLPFSFTGSVAHGAAINPGEALAAARVIEATELPALQRHLLYFLHAAAVSVGLLTALRSLGSPTIAIPLSSSSKLPLSLHARVWTRILCTGLALWSAVVVHSPSLWGEAVALQAVPRATAANTVAAADEDGTCAADDGSSAAPAAESSQQQSHVRGRSLLDQLVPALLLAADPADAASLVHEGSPFTAIRGLSAVVLHCIAALVPAAGGQHPAAIASVTTAGHPHPHAYLLELLIAHRPRHTRSLHHGHVRTGSHHRVSDAASGVSVPRAVGIYFSLTEVLLRDSLAADTGCDAGHAFGPAASATGRITPHLARLTRQLVVQLKDTPVVETRLSAAMTVAELQTQTLLAASSLAALPPRAIESLPAAAAGAVAVCALDALASPLEACCVYLARVKNRQLAAAAPIYRVGPMHPAFVDLGLPQPAKTQVACPYVAAAAQAAPVSDGPAAAGVRAAVSAASALDAAVSAPTAATAAAARPDELAIPVPEPGKTAHSFASLAALVASASSAASSGEAAHALAANVSCERSVSAEYDVNAAVAGVDHVLVGLLRLVTACVEADPLYAGDLALPATASAQAGGRTYSLFSTAVVPLPAAAGHAAAAAHGMAADGGTGADLVNAIFDDFLFGVLPVETAMAKDAGAQSGGLLRRTSQMGVTTSEPIAVLSRIIGSKAPGVPGPKCKTVASRAAAFALLTSLTRRSTRAASLLSWRLQQDMVKLAYMDTRSTFVAPGAWRMSPAAQDAVSPAGYVGLRNLGCICYMNALMQQFYMMEPLRYGLLCVPATEFLPDKERGDSVLAQLQRMMAFLDASARRHYDPAPWCHAYKDMDGKPTNHLVQQDAQEYLTTLLDRVEYALKPTLQAGLVQHVLGLETREARFCTGGCGTLRSSSEPTVCLSLSVQGGTMAGSLDSFVAWEDIPDYECDACKRRTMLRKRNTLGRLGNTLIVHLKRFEMNYETGVPAKLNDRFEFPPQLDLFPYSYQAFLQQQQQQAAAATASSAGAGAPSASAAAAAPADAPDFPREYYDFDLVGVVVHTGTLESGHYYSFIRERGPRAFVKATERAAAIGEAPPTHPDAAAAAAAAADGAASTAPPPHSLGPAFTWRGRWMEFNDSTVSDFDPARIAEQCFGGTTTTSTYSAALKQQVTTEVPVLKNAYMLVYERRVPQAVEVAAFSVPHLAPAASAAAAATALPPQRTLRILPGQLVPLDASGRGPMPSSVLKAVLQDNDAFAVLCNHMEPEFGSFLHSYADTVTRHPLMAAPAARDTEAARSAPEETSLSSDSALFDPLTRLRTGDEGGPAWIEAVNALGAAGLALPDVCRQLQGGHGDASLAHALAALAFLPLARSAHGAHLLPHMAYSICKLLAAQGPIGAEQFVRRTLLAPLAGVGGGYDLLRESLVRCPVASVRGAMSRVVLAAVLQVLLVGSEARQMPLRMEKLLPHTAPPRIAVQPTVSTAGRELLTALLAPETLDAATTGWRANSSLFATLYDIARLGYGCGLPLTAWTAEVLETARATSVGSAGGDGDEPVLARGAAEASHRAHPASFLRGEEAGLAAYTAGAAYEDVTALLLQPAASSEAAAAAVGAVAAFHHALVCGHRVRSGMLQAGAIEAVLDYYLGTRRTVFCPPGVVAGAPRKQRPLMGSKTATPSWARALDTAALLARSMYTRASEENGPVPPTAVVLGPVRRVPHGTDLEAAVAAVAAANTAAAIKAALTTAFPAGAPEPWPATLPEGVPTDAAEAAAMGHAAAEAAEAAAAATAGAPPTLPPAVLGQFPILAPLPAAYYVPPSQGGAPSPFLSQRSRTGSTGSALYCGSGGDSGPLARQSALDAAVSRRSRDSCAATNARTATVIAAVAQLPKGRGVPVGGKVVSTAEQALAAGRDVPPVVADLRRENAFAKAARDRAGEREGFVPLDTDMSSNGFQANGKRGLYADELWGTLLGLASDHSEHHFPGATGPNLSAVCALAAHLSYQDAAFSRRLLKSMSKALEATLDVEVLRPLFALAEALACVPDTLAQFRRGRIGAWLWQALESMRGGGHDLTELYLEHTHALLRLAALVPSVATEVVLEAPRLAALEWRLRCIEADAKSGGGKAPAWLAAAVDAEARVEVAQAVALVAAAQSKSAAEGKPAAVASGSALALVVAASAMGLSDREAAQLPFKRYLVSRIVHPRACVDLSCRDEIHILNAVALSPSLRATLLLQRLRRVAVAHGCDLLGHDACRRRVEETDAAEAAVAAAAKAGVQVGAVQVGAGAGDQSGAGQ